ncbi:MAG TPA: adenylate kinase [Candidatus Baltobacteraceae bacterium]|jgi:adenylate kinase|nr:adenylate kinase [Candidatus Baltobacteraceae bacterium]
MRLIFLGPPGAGKGTQARILAERFGARHVSTGDLLRDHRERKTALGIEAQSFMAKGALVPDDLMIRMLDAELADTASFILDGFPRTIVQADALGEFLTKRNLPLDAVLSFDLPREELIARLTGRWTNPRTGRSYHERYDPPIHAGVDDDDGGPLVQRGDDMLEVVEQRLVAYESMTSPLVSYYEAKGLLVHIDGTRSAERVTDQILDELAHSGVGKGAPGSQNHSAPHCCGLQH